MEYSVGDILRIPEMGVAKVLSVAKLQPTPDDEAYYWCKLEFFATRRGTLPSGADIIRMRAIKGGCEKLESAPPIRIQWCHYKNERNSEILYRKKQMFVEEDLT